MNKLVFVIPLLLLSGCIVEDNIFFDNVSANQYKHCYNESLNLSAEFEMELRTTCYSEVYDDKTCDKGSYSYFGCKKLLNQYSECLDTDKLRKNYRKECMQQ